MTNKPLMPPPPHHEWVLTEDGSFSIFSNKYQESAHSIHGAISETKLRFTQGCNLEDLMNSTENNLTVFEVGYGLGIGALETISLWLKQKRNSNLIFISCEIDIELIHWCISNSEALFKSIYGEKVISVIQNLKYIEEEKVYKANNINNLTLIIIPGDITSSDYLAKNYKEKVDCIFQDAYSPKKNPELWSLEWFLKMKAICKKNSILSTYSSSQSVRENLVNAGFRIENGPGFGKKKSSTFAFPI